jgi:hypothetical protein
MATAHKLIGGSKIKLTLKCPGSPLAQSYLPNLSSEAAERGTRIHGWLEKYLTKTLSSMEGLTDRDISEALIGVNCGKEIERVIDELGFAMSELNVEQMLDFHPDYPEAGGTPDVDGAVAFHDGITVDLKTGNGQIAPEENPQLLLYAVSRYNSLDPFVRSSLNNWHLVIVQPQEDGTITVRTWTLPAADLLAWEAIFKMGIDKVRANPELRTPGDHCLDEWCNARGVCPARLQWIDDQTHQAFDRAVHGDVDKNPGGERLMAIIRAEKHILDLVETAKKTMVALKQANPEEYPEVELKPNYSHKKFDNVALVDEWAAINGLTPDDYKPRSVITPAKLQELATTKGITTDLPPTSQTVTSYSIKLVTLATFAPPPEAAPPAPKKRTRRKAADTQPADSTQPEMAGVTG